jgi:hypothetical protein
MRAGLDPGVEQPLNSGERRSLVPPLASVAKPA